jgi:hypothetical protein
MIGFTEEEQPYSSNRYENEEETIEDNDLSSNYFDEEIENDLSEENQIEQNEIYYEEGSIDFLTIFSGAVSEFFSSGAFNVIIDLSSGSSDSGSSNNSADSNLRNNSGSRNYDGR